MGVTPEISAVLKNLGIEQKNYGAFNGSWFGSGKTMASISPIDGSTIAEIVTATQEDYHKVVEEAQKAFEMWRMTPAPKRGEVARQISLELRKHKDDLGALVTLEMGKILEEGKGEVQEMIDIFDFAVGLSRQLYGKTMHSERPLHRMYEQWHPLGITGIITAFNFPVAVWSWNSAISSVCGNSMVWKPSLKTPLTAIACQKIAQRVFAANGYPAAVMSMVIGEDQEIGEALTHDERIPLVSATGSVRMGRRVGQVVASRLGKTILELGGNNGIIVSDKANLDMALRAILFGAVGTAGQRCTTTRRVIIHESVYGQLKERLLQAYQQIKIGNPLEQGILMGPLIDQDAFDNMQKALTQFKEQGGRVLYGGDRLEGQDYQGGVYVTPVLAEADEQLPIIQEETFAPILYLMKYREIEQAIALHNGVPQGLSSAIFTTDLQEVEKYLSHAGSDCGISNVNIGTSGAEIGGAFGGEKHTGGGREAGSDAWKAYMRRQTNTINWSSEMPLAQGIQFGD